MMSKRDNEVVHEDVDSDVDENALVDVDDSGSDGSIPSPTHGTPERLTPVTGSPGVPHEDMRDTPTPEGSLSPGQASDADMKGKPLPGSPVHKHDKFYNTTEYCHVFTSRRCNHRFSTFLNTS